MKKYRSPWWIRFTPLTEAQLNSVRLPPFAAFKKIEAGDFTVNDLGVIICHLKIGTGLAKHYNEESEAKVVLETALARMNKQDFSDLDSIHAAIVLVDDMLMSCERFRVCQAIKEVLG